MTDAHTPGPWTVEMTCGSTYIKSGKSGDGYYVARTVSACGLNKDGSSQSAANAHLIAAAPELLQELQRSADCLATFISEHTDPGTEALAALHCARAAIAKARLSSLTKG